MTEVRIRVPRPPTGLLGNLLGLAGLIAVAAAIGGLTGNWWWSALVGGVFAVTLSWIAATHVEVGKPATAPGQPRLVAAAKTG